MGFRLVPISIALNDRNARLYPTQLLSELAAEKGIDPYYRGQRRELRVCAVYVHVCTHVQCIFAGRLTPNLDFEVSKSQYYYFSTSNSSKIMYKIIILS